MKTCFKNFYTKLHFCGIKPFNSPPALAVVNLHSFYKISLPVQSRDYLSKNDLELNAYG